jgi:uncharacterized protein YbgA (DUF1722 family)
LVCEKAFGREAAEMAESITEYDPHPPFVTGVTGYVPPTLLAHLDAQMAETVEHYRQGALNLSPRHP